MREIFIIKHNFLKSWLNFFCESLLFMYILAKTTLKTTTGKLHFEHVIIN